jgi:Arc/MetJ family transcription regulator
MRTTIDIDDDILAAVKERARLQRHSAGKVVSELLRQALAGARSPAESDHPGVGGFRPFPDRGVVVTNDQIDHLRDDEGV